MNLEVGKKYRTRDGKLLVKIIRDSSQYPLEGQVDFCGGRVTWHWARNGIFNKQTQDLAHLDLVEEVMDEAPGYHITHPPVTDRLTDAELAGLERVFVRNDTTGHGPLPRLLAEIRTLREENKEMHTKLVLSHCAAVKGAMAAAKGLPLHTVSKSGYTARSLCGDAWESGWQQVANEIDIPKASQGECNGLEIIKQLTAERDEARAAALKHDMLVVQARHTIERLIAERDEALEAMRQLAATILTSKDNV